MRWSRRREKGEEEEEHGVKEERWRSMDGSVEQKVGV